MEQLVLLLIIGLISFINWLMQRSAKMREQRKLERAGGPDTLDGPNFSDVEESTEVEPSVENPDESMRKLMEALGIPQDEPAPTSFQPPPPLPVPAERPRLPSPSFDPARPKFAETPTQVRKGLGRSVAAVVERRETSRFRTLISSQAGLRDAIVLAEILGPPQSLKR